MREGKHGGKKSAGCVEWKKKYGSIFQKGAGNGRKVRRKELARSGGINSGRGRGRRMVDEEFRKRKAKGKEKGWRERK